MSASSGGDVLLVSTSWMDDLWDPEARLLWTVRRDRHMVRETAWYALGLLQRSAPGDEARAIEAIGSVLAHQYDASGRDYHGTFRRAPEEADPPDDPVMWVHYDPNWRQFIGTTLAVIHDRFDLPHALHERVVASITLAASSEPPERVAPTYANIALMKAWLDRWVGVRDNDAARIEAGDALARDIADHFDEHGAFLEYNSPTYYGIDLWALALWRHTDGELAELGTRIASALWRDIARFYHAGLRNLCGPFDRAYGMDMTRYATPLGLWIWGVTGRESAPFPDPTQAFSHPHDFAFGPLVGALGEPDVPDDVIAELREFSGERLAERTITTEPSRYATAWLGPNAMVGAHAGPPSGIGWMQHHHATMHWRTPDGHLGWMRLRPDVVAEAHASPGRLEIRVTAPGVITFETSGDPESSSLDAGNWVIGGREIEIATNATGMSVAEDRGLALACYEPAGRPPTVFDLRL